jgi:FAD/FMN-containing dehydrogenase
MTEYQITSWHQIPSMVVARDGDDVAKVQLAARFQEAIDEAAMRMGETDADAYLAGWTKSPWLEMDGTPADVANRIATELETELTDDALIAILDALNGA